MYQNDVKQIIKSGWIGMEWTHEHIQQVDTQYNKNNYARPALKEDK